MFSLAQGAQSRRKDETRMEDQSPATEKPTRRDMALLGLRKQCHIHFHRYQQVLLSLSSGIKETTNRWIVETRTETEYKEPMLGAESSFTISHKIAPCSVSPEPSDADCTHKSKHLGMKEEKGARKRIRKAVGLEGIPWSGKMQEISHLCSHSLFSILLEQSHLSKWSLLKTYSFLPISHSTPARLPACFSGTFSRLRLCLQHQL